MKRVSTLLSLVLLSLFTMAQPPLRMSTIEYIQKYKGDAIREMNKMGVPASITLAQGILESDCGNSDLAREARNHFGIKCHKEWDGETYIKDDDTKNECFRKYRSVLDSYEDHGRFLRERPRYAFLFEFDVTDYQKWAYGLKQAGYATNPKYADLLIKIIEENNLQQYDKGGHNVPIADEGSVQNQSSRPNASKQPYPVPSESAQRHRQAKGNVQYNSHEVPYLVAKQGDSWLSVASANDIRMWQVLKYNDASKNDDLKPGDIVYLKPKRGTPVEKYHSVSAGESLRSIAQRYGVKMKRLIKLNKLENGYSVQPGQKIRLK